MLAVFTNLFGMDINELVKFNGLNYADWSEQIQFQLGIMDLDLVIVCDEKPPTITRPVLKLTSLFMRLGSGLIG